MDAARQLLREQEMQLITLPDIAAAAGIPRASAYHFFSDVQDLYRSVAEQVQEELFEWQQQVDELPASEWRHIVEAYVRRGAQFFRSNKDALQLLLGPYTPAIVKQSDRKSDLLLATQLLKMVNSKFKVPQILNREEKFYHAIEIADLMFCLSVLRHSTITPHYEDEAVLASTQYLSAYIPSIIQSASPSDHGSDTLHEASVNASGG